MWFYSFSIVVDGLCLSDLHEWYCHFLIEDSPHCRGQRSDSLYDCFWKDWYPEALGWGRCLFLLESWAEHAYEVLVSYFFSSYHEYKCLIPIQFCMFSTCFMIAVECDQWRLVWVVHEAASWGATDLPASPFNIIYYTLSTVLGDDHQENRICSEQHFYIYLMICSILKVHMYFENILLCAFSWSYTNKTFTRWNWLYCKSKKQSYRIHIKLDFLFDFRKDHVLTMISAIQFWNRQR